MIFIVALAAGLCLAFANGANDNFKGVATLFGSGTTSFWRALIWATATTFLGSLAAFALAGNLMERFGGKGLVDDAMAAQSAFASSVALGAGLTVLLATRFGMPISTTHSLVGALVGTGMIAGTTLNVTNLGARFFLPLLASPILAVVVTGIIYPLLRRMPSRLGITYDICLCVGDETLEVSPAGHQAMAM